MKCIKISKYVEAYYFNNGRIFTITSYDFDNNILKEIGFNYLKLIRNGTYAYCYDFIATLKDKEAINDNE